MSGKAAKVSWSHKVTIRLIELYELQPVLYKVTSPDYHNKSARHVALESIQKELEYQFQIQFPVVAILKKLHNLRSQFNECERQNKLQSGRGASDKPQWYLYEQLLFLKPNVQKDKGRSNLKADRANEQMIDVEEDRAESPVSQRSESPFQELVTANPLDLECHLSEERDFQSSRSSSQSLSLSPLQPQSSLTIKQSSISQQEKKRKLEDVVIAAIKKIQQGDVVTPPSSASSVPNHLQVFSQMVGYELSLLENPKTVQQCKWEIMQIIQNAQRNEM